MAISLKTRKKLWGRAAARCSFPGCSEILYEDSLSTLDPHAIIGEEAHIYAKSPGGPRFNSKMSGDMVDQFANLILLCRNHHKVIDDQPIHYSPAVVQDMKRAHEDKIHSLLAESHAVSPAAKIPTLQPILDDEHSQRWDVGGSFILVEMFGSRPFDVGNGWWRGSGFLFVHELRPGYSKEICTWGEAEFDIEYCAHDGSLIIVEFTFDPSSNDVVRFCEHTYRFTSTEIEHDKNILFCPGEISETPSEIWQEIDSGEMACSETAMYLIRNAGMSCPQDTIDLFQALFQKSRLDGAVAEVAHSAIRDLETVIDTAKR